MITTILKRDGTVAPYNENKINLVIDYACQNLRVDSNKLKEKIKLFIHEGIATEQIQKILINNASSFLSLEETDWKYATARLVLLDLYKRAKRTQKYDYFGYGDFLEFVNRAVDLGLYDRAIVEKYSQEEIKELGQEIKPEYDLGYDYGGVMSMYDRYLIKSGGQVFELPQQMYMVCAMFIARNEPRATRLKWVKKFYHACGDRFLSLATPILLNLRKPKGNLASCFIAAMGDSLDSIYSVLEQAAQISKNAGGVGINISRVRSHGSSIRGHKSASGGVFGWIKLLNDTAVSVNQLGSRSGAITIALDVWHRDIMEFLEIQAENGDQRNKSYDIFPQIVVNDLFLKRYKSGGDWMLFDPHEVRNSFGIELAELWGERFEEAFCFLEKAAAEGKLELAEKVDPRVIVRRALQSAMETGMPYWFNKDTVNKANPNKHVGMIGSANLCVESFSNFSATEPTDVIIDEDDNGNYTARKISKLGYTHVCNLISLNASKIYTNQEIEYYTRLSVRILDNLIDVGTPPVPEASVHNDDYRILGVGMLGYHDHLIKQGLRYSDAVDYTNTYWEKIAYYAVDESSNLARDRGRYRYFEGSDWSKGIFFGRDARLPKFGSTELNWVGLADKVKDYGMRNGGLLAVAPNTSTSIVVGASASMLPVFDVSFNEKNSLGTFPVIAQFLTPETLWMYESFKNIDQKHVIRVCTTAQRWIDQGISMELMLNLDLVKKAVELRDLYIYAMDHDAKTIYYLRSKTKKKAKKEEPKPVEKEDVSCFVCAN